MRYIQDNYGHRFEVVDKYPDGYKFWNIKPIGNFLALYKPNSSNPYNVDTSDLKALYIENTDDLEAIKKAVSWGRYNSKLCLAYIRRYKGKSHTELSQHKLEICENALKAYQKIGC